MKKAGIILLAGITALTACQSRQTIGISEPEDISTAEVNSTAETMQTPEVSAEADTAEAPAVLTEEARQNTAEAIAEDREPPVFRPIEVAQAALDEYFTEWENREDGQRISDHRFTINDDMLLMHDGSRFVVFADFTVLPVQYEWTNWAAYAEPGEDGRITDSRFFTVRREGAKYHVTDIGTGAFHRPYSDLIAGIAAGEKPDEFSLEWFCPSEAAEYVLTEHFEQAKQDEGHPISDFGFEIDGGSVVSEGNGAFSIRATIRVLPSNTDNENIGYWTGANGVTLDNGWIESYRWYTLERENGVYKIAGTGTAVGCIPYLSDEWNMWWS